ncbi:GtrA family protein [Ideonella margarita]|uniref:GtrA family protein n=1 Tax=Ideonella margarita TaxID=2984191 RepID=A0ABU9C4S4_9BURK
MKRDAALWLRFLLAGAANTGFGLLVYALTLQAGAADWVALLLGLVMGVIFNFLSMGGYAFRDLSWARAPRFVLAYALLYAVNLLLLRALNTWLGSPLLAQVLLTPLMAGLSYLMLSRWVFTRQEAA